MPGPHNARLKPGMKVRDYTKPGTGVYGSLWDVIAVEVRVDGVMDFLEEAIYLVTLSDDTTMRTVLVPASAPGYAILLPDLRFTQRAVPLANALGLVGYPISERGLEQISAVAGGVGYPRGISIITSLALHSVWFLGARDYQLRLLNQDGLEYGFDVPEQDAQVLAITPAPYPASQYTLEALGH